MLMNENLNKTLEKKIAFLLVQTSKNLPFSLNDRN